LTLLYFIRHAHHDLVGRVLVGRAPGARLSEEGRAQTARLGQALAETPIAAVLSSPSERTLETAEPIAAQHGLLVTVAQGLAEVDFGDWTGRSFAELERDPAWHAFNHARARAAIPGGERMIDVQSRAVALVESLIRQYPDHCLALVSHGDVIRVSLMHYLGIPLDFIHRLHIGPASTSLLEADVQGCRLLGINLGSAALGAGTVG
jgi:broad specificity phosphatase PhoE